VLGDVERRRAETGRRQEPGGDGGELRGGDGPEDIGEEVEPDVIEIRDERVAAEGDQVREESCGGAEQRCGVEPNPQLLVPEPPSLVANGGHAGDDRLRDLRVIAIEVRVAGHIRLLGDLDGGGGVAVPSDQLSEIGAVPGDVARSRLVLGDQVQAPPAGRVPVRSRGRDRHQWVVAGPVIVTETEVGAHQEGPLGVALQLVEGGLELGRIIWRSGRPSAPVISGNTAGVTPE
jgi:hypothetical protein